MDDDTFEALRGALVAAGERTQATVGKVRPGGWDEVIHTGDGAWTRRQLLAHIAANDLRQLIRIRVGAGIPLAGDDVALTDEQQLHAWNQARVDERAGASVEALRVEMRSNRAALLGLLRSLTPVQRDCLVPFRGQPTPLAEMLPVVSTHLENHAAELVAE